MTVEERLDRTEKMQEKNQILSAQILESIIRLERIVVSHSFEISDINKRLDELEKKHTKVN